MSKTSVFCVSRNNTKQLDYNSLFWKYSKYSIISVQWFRTLSIFESFSWIRVSYFLLHVFCENFANTKLSIKFQIKFEYEKNCVSSFAKQENTEIISFCIALVLTLVFIKAFISIKIKLKLNSVLFAFSRELCTTCHLSTESGCKESVKFKIWQENIFFIISFSSTVIYFRLV